MAKRITIDEIIAKKMNNPEFKKAFEEESARLESAVSLMKAREKAGLTQVELAERAGVPQSTVARIERGDSTKTSTLEKLAEAMGATMTYTYKFD